MVASMAFISPRWWSEVTSCTPRRPPSRRARRNSVQKSAVSESPTAQPKTCRRPSVETPVAITTAWEDTRAPFPALSPPTRALQ
jgi:hypothetical protein